MQSCQSCTVWYRMVVHSILLVGSLAFKRVSINDQSCCVQSLTGYLGLLLLLDLVHHEWDVFSLLTPTMAGATVMCLSCWERFSLTTLLRGSTQKVGGDQSQSGK